MARAVGDERAKIDRGAPSPRATLLERALFALFAIPALVCTALIFCMAGLSVMAFDAPDAGRHLWPYLVVVGFPGLAIACALLVARATRLFRSGRTMPAYAALSVPIACGVLLFALLRLT